LRRAVFLDRDGTLIRHVPYLTDPADVALLPGAAEAVRRLRARGYACVLVTNQSAIGRGMLTVEGLHDVHAELVRQLDEAGTALDDWRFCPSVPSSSDRSEVDDEHRKPGPGMLLESARELALDLSRSWMIGDMISDVLAGRNAGCLGSILVRSGSHRPEDESHPAVDHVADDLGTAADMILELDAATAARQGA